MDIHQTIENCKTNRKYMTGFGLLLLSMMAGLFWLVDSTRSIAVETKGEVSQIKWIIENHYGKAENKPAGGYVTLYRKAVK